MNERAHRSFVRVVIQGSLLACVLAFEGTAMVSLGSHSVASQSSYQSADPSPAYMLECPVSQTLKKGTAGADIGRDCSAKARLHTVSSRTPGAGLIEQVHRGDP